MTDARFKRAERRVAEILDTQRTPLSGSNSRHTASDTLHPDLFVEVKLAKDPPLWDEMLKLRQRARRRDLAPMILLTHPDEGTRIAIVDLEVLVDQGLAGAHGRVLDVLSEFHVQHRPFRRSAWYTLMDQVRPLAVKESKRALIVYKASGRPGEVCGFTLDQPWPLGGP